MAFSPHPASSMRTSTSGLTHVALAISRWPSDGRPDTAGHVVHYAMPFAIAALIVVLFWRFPYPSIRSLYVSVYGRAAQNSWKKLPLPAEMQTQICLCTLNEYTVARVHGEDRDVA